MLRFLLSNILACHHVKEENVNVGYIHNQERTICHKLCRLQELKTVRVMHEAFLVLQQNLRPYKLKVFGRVISFQDQHWWFVRRNLLLI
jgi:hypothetical protein